MTHGTQAPETPDERAATHAPKTELPTMTAAHVYALNWIRREWLDVPEPEISYETRRFHEVAANIAAQVSGEAKLVPTAELRKLWNIARGDTDFSDDKIIVRTYLDLSRWLTPEDERHE